MTVTLTMTEAQADLVEEALTGFTTATQFTLDMANAWEKTLPVATEYLGLAEKVAAEKAELQEQLDLLHDVTANLVVAAGFTDAL